MRCKNDGMKGMKQVESSLYNALATEQTGGADDTHLAH